MDRGAPDPLRADYNYTTDASMTFVQDVPSGTYDVTVIIGNQTSARNGLGVILEGVQVDTVNTTLFTSSSDSRDTQLKLMRLPTAGARSA